jgi:hypothetical protein
MMHHICPISLENIPLHREILLDTKVYDANCLSKMTTPFVPHTRRKLTDDEIARIESIAPKESEVPPLRIAMLLGDHEGVIASIRAGADVNEDASLFSGAVSLGRTGIVRSLIQAGAHVSYPDSSGITPLMLAVVNGNIAIVEALVDAGAPIDHQDIYGRTALTISIAYERLDIIRAILRAGADVNRVHNDGLCRGVTPLFHAVVSGNEEIVTLVLDAGADIFHKDVDGNMAFKWSRNPRTRKLTRPTLFSRIVRFLKKTFGFCR